VNQFSDRTLHDTFVHSDQINERMEFIKACANKYDILFKGDLLNVLWDQLVETSPLQSD